MRLLPWIFMAILLPAEGSIRPISFSQYATAAIRGTYAWNPEGPAEFAVDYRDAGFSHGSYDMPAQPHHAHVEGGGLPDLPEVRWFAPGPPLVDFRLEVPIWSHPPATDGNWRSCEIRMVATSYGVNGSTMPSNLDLRFEFETTEAIELQYTGWVYFNLDQNQFASPPLDHLGRLSPGRHSFRTLPAGLPMSLPATTVVYSLILGPNPPDSDGDEISDYDETTTHHTNPNQADTDGDGLSDSIEVRTVHSNPLLVDTDGDGFKDGFEKDSGKNPLAASDAPVAAITLNPAVITPEPTMELRILTKLGVRYQLQSSSSLQGWTDQGTVREGTGDEVSVLQPLELGSKFWRLAEVVTQ